MRPTYDVVIVTFNNAEIIGEVLRSVYDSDHPPNKVIVYDSASTDRTRAVIRADFSRVTLIEGVNRGFGAGNNAGVRVAESEFILFVNPDLKVAPDCARLLLGGMAADPRLALVTPLIYRGWDTNVQDVYAFGSFVDQAGFAYSNTDINTAVPTNSFSGACFLTRRSTMLAYPFDERNFLYYEELDLTVNILKTGGLIGKVLEAECWHLENYSSPEKRAAGIDFRQFHAIQNRWALVGRHWPSQLLLYAATLNALHLAYFLVYFLRNSQWRYLSLAWVAPVRFAQGLMQGRQSGREDTRARGWHRSLRKSSVADMMRLKRAVLRPEGGRHKP